MAQFTNYAAIPIQQPNNSGIDNILQNFVRGYQVAAMPRQMRDQQALQQLQRQALQNQINMAPGQLFGQQLNNERMQMQNQFFPDEQKARLALLNAQAQKQLQPAGEVGPRFNGEIANAVALENMAEQLGEQDPRVIAARKAAKDKDDYQKSLIDYKDKYSNSIDKRAATALGKQNLELDDINAGFAPGTRRTQTITPEQQDKLRNEYALSIQKGTTDAATRGRTLFAANIEKTIQSINPENLLRYSGLKGQIEKGKEFLKASVGKESQEYDAYNESKSAAELAAKELRQFLADSIQPSEMERLQKLLNPENWHDSPQLAQKKLNTALRILRNETQTYQDALKGPQIYQGSQSGNTGSTPNPQGSGMPNQAQNYAIKPGFVLMYSKDGRPHSIPEARSKEAEEKGFRRG